MAKNKDKKKNKKKIFKIKKTKAAAALGSGYVFDGGDILNLAKMLPFSADPEWTPEMVATHSKFIDYTRHVDMTLLPSEDLTQR